MSSSQVPFPSSYWAKAFRMTCSSSVPVVDTSAKAIQEEGRQMLRKR
jgi:hypothetical protein